MQIIFKVSLLNQDIHILILKLVNFFKSIYNIRVLFVPRLYYFQLKYLKPCSEKV